MHSIAVLHHTGPSWLPQTQTWLYNQIRYLPNQIQNHIVCENVENLEQFHLPNIHSLKQASRWRYYWDKGLRKLQLRHHLEFLTNQLQKNKIQILHSHFGTVAWGDIKAAQKAKVKHIVTYYGQDVNYFPQQDARWYQRYRQLFAHIDHVLCEGPFMAKTIINMGCPAEKVSVHHLGIAIDKIPFKPRQWQRAIPLRILMAASFQEKKGFPYALEALGILQHELPIEITIIGDAKNESRSLIEKDMILAKIKKHKLDTKIRMLGFQPHQTLFEEAYKHHLFLSPSVTSSDGDTEGGAPVSLIEMAATGMPIVSTTHCDIPNVIQHQKSGLLATERDVDGLVEHLNYFIAHPEKWNEFAKAGRKRVEQEFQVEIQSDRLSKIYKSLV